MNADVRQPGAFWACPEAYPTSERSAGRTLTEGLDFSRFVRRNVPWPYPSSPGARVARSYRNWAAVRILVYAAFDSFALSECTAGACASCATSFSAGRYGAWPSRLPRPSACTSHLAVGDGTQTGLSRVPRISLNACWDLLPGAPALTGTGLSRVGDAQQVDARSLRTSGERASPSRRDTRAVWSTLRERGREPSARAWCHRRLVHRRSTPNTKRNRRGCGRTCARGPRALRRRPRDSSR